MQQGIFSPTGLRMAGLAGLSLALVFLLPVTACDSKALSKTSGSMVGGACEYKAYSGEAQIMAVDVEEGTYDVRFVFHSETPVMEEFARREGRTWSMRRADLTAPDAEFIEKHGIRPGARYPAVMHVITRGTCSPVMFDFPSLSAPTHRQRPDRNKIKAFCRT